MTRPTLGFEAQNQVSTATFPLVGTPHSLQYQSNRVPGFAAARADEIPVSGDSLPDSLRRIELELTVAGQRITETFPPEPNQSYEFAWDGTDAYDRQTQGFRSYEAEIGYVYPGVYNEPAERQASFARFARSDENHFPQSITGSTTREEIIISNTLSGTFGGWDAAGQGFGGWTLDAHHVYDPYNESLVFGYGEQRTNVAPSIRTIAGTGVTQGTADVTPGSEARRVRFRNPTDIAVRPDGGYYVVEWIANRIVHVGPDGVVQRVLTGDPIQYPTDIAVGADGAAYFVQWGGHSPVRRIGADGSMEIVAGGGDSTEDGVPATEARLGGLTGIVDGIDVDPRGRLYVAESGRVRRVEQDGTISTVAGGGDETNDGAMATEHVVESRDVAVGSDGRMYVLGGAGSVQATRLYQVTPDGRIATVAGGGSGEMVTGARATDVALPTVNFEIGGSAVVVGPNDDPYLHLADRVFRLAPDGTLELVAGSGRADFTFDDLDGIPAKQANFRDILGLDIAPDGSLYLADGSRSRAYRVSTALPGFATTGYTIASEDGQFVYEFDRQGRHLQTRDALTGAVRYRFEYDDRGLLVAVTDGDGNSTRFIRADDGRLRSVRSPAGRTTTFEHDPNGFLSRVVNPGGATAEFAYTTGGLLAEATDKNGNTQTFTYDTNGRLRSQQLPGGGEYDIVRSAQPQEVTTTVLSPGLEEQRFCVRELPSGGQRRTNACCGVAVVSEHDDASRRVSSPDGTTSELTVSGDPRFGMEAPYGRSVSVETPGGRTLDLSAERTVEPQAAASSGDVDLEALIEEVTVGERSYVRRYDAGDRTITTTSPGGRTTTTSLDQRGRPTRLETPGSAPTMLSYDDRGNLSRIATQDENASREVRFEYDDDGLPTRVTDALDRETTLSYDDAARLTQQTLPGGETVTYDYDASGNVTGIAPPGRPQHEFTYTDGDNLAAYRPPGVGEQPTETTYNYDDAGRMSRITLPGGDRVAVSYDAAGRIGSVSAPRSTLEYRYDDETGKVTDVQAAHGADLTYEHDGPLTTSVTWSGPVEGTVGFSYGDSFRVTATAVGDMSIPYTYDDDGFQVTAGSLELSRDEDTGRLVGSTLGGLRDNWTYDSFGGARRYTATHGGEERYDVQYGHDVLGRIETKTETVDGETVSYRYSYDQAGRLVEVRRNGSVQHTYEYDANGNRTREDGPDGTVTAEYDAQDRLVRYGQRQYDHRPDGHRIRERGPDGTTEYDYDVLGNLRAVDLPDGRRVAYEVDARNRRVARRVDGEVTRTFLYGDQLNPIAELDADGTVRSRFVYATRTNVPAYMIRDGRTYRFVCDHLGSPRLVVDVSSGEVVQRLDYDAWGRVQEDTNPGFQPFGFAGGLYDPATGLVRFGARDYDPRVGRWTAKDPITFAGGDPNLYAYVGNDPVNRTDPSGLVLPLLILAAVGYIVAGTVSAAKLRNEGTTSEAALRQEFITGGLRSVIVTLVGGAITAAGTAGTAVTVGTVIAARAVAGLLSAMIGLTFDALTGRAATVDTFLTDLLFAAIGPGEDLVKGIAAGGRKWLAELLKSAGAIGIDMLIDYGLRSGMDTLEQVFDRIDELNRAQSGPGTPNC